MEKVLFLGSRLSVTELVKAAKARGMYTIVTDYYGPEYSTSKQYSDEAWSISTLDLDALEKKCREEGVTAIMTGISMSAIPAMIELCSRLNLPCCYTKESWFGTLDKRNFKDMCIRNKLPVSRDYILSTVPTEEELDQIQFPVVVKATDLHANRGMSYCYNKEEVVKAVSLAQEVSGHDTVIVEKMLQGHEYAAWYALADGEAELIDFGIMLSPSGYPSNIYTFTSTDTDKKDYFKQHIDANMKNMLKDAGCKEGIAWVEMMADTDGQLYMLEMGYRVSGDMIAQAFYRSTGFDSYNWLLDISIGKKHTVEDLKNIKTNDTGKYACSYILWNEVYEDKKITGISGFEKIADNPKVEVTTFPMMNVGLNSAGYLGIITFAAKDWQEAQSIIESVNETVSITSDDQDIVIRFKDFDVLRDNAYKKN